MQNELIHIKVLDSVLKIVHIQPKYWLLLLLAQLREKSFRNWNVCLKQLGASLLWPLCLGLKRSLISTEHSSTWRGSFWKVNLPAGLPGFRAQKVSRKEWLRVWPNQKKRSYVSPNTMMEQALKCLNKMNFSKVIPTLSRVWARWDV